jgi:predicted transcriptional regulator
MKTEREKTRWKVILQILSAPDESKKVKKTRIMHLDHRYFDFLLEEGFIAECNPDPECYKLTEDGQNLLRDLKEVNRSLH